MSAIHSISLIFLMIIVFVQSQNEQQIISINEPQIPQLVKQFFAAEPNAQVYQLTFLPQPPSARQIVFYGPDERQSGQPILINPGNLPGNFLIPQAPTPNFIPRNNNNPQNPTALFPNNAVYPKPAHIPAVNKDAEEVSTNPAKIPPLLRPVKSKGKAQGKPEKIETFTETTQQEDEVNNRKENPFLLNPEQTSLRPGQRFFVLNGENIYNYPYEETLSASPDQTFQILSPFAKAPPAQSATSSNLVQQLSIPNYIYRQSYAENQQETQKNNENIIRTAQQYFRTAPSSLINPQQPQNFEINHDQGSFINNNNNNPEEESVEPQLVGHFKFSPNDLNNNNNQFVEDVENDAVVVEAINFDSSVLTGNQKLTSDREPNSKPLLEVEPLEKDLESSMAEAGPQATAIAGPGGVAGSAPRATAIVGNGGLAISSPQATAVAGTTEEKKKNTTKPLEKNE